MLELNALDVLKQRELDHVPPHFAKMKIAEKEIISDQIVDWIRSKLNGRFYLKKIPSILSNDKLGVSVYVAFEDHKELTYFMLACPYLRRK